MDLGELRIIGRSPTVMVGDIVKGGMRLTWRKESAEEVALAEQVFNEYVSKGWLAVGEASGKKKQIFTFDPSLNNIVLAPLMMGG